MRNAPYAHATITAETKMRFLEPNERAANDVTALPSSPPSTAPKPNKPYKRLACRESKMFAATSHPCETSTMLNKLTHTLNTYSIHGRPGPTAHHSTIRHATASDIAQATATCNDAFSAI